MALATTDRNGNPPCWRPDAWRLVPITWSTGTGSEVMQRIAVPMIGGMVSSTVLTLVVIATEYTLIKGWNLSRAGKAMVTLRV